MKKAINAGFRGVDTACQPKHYSEALVGRALSEIFSEVRVGESWDDKEDEKG